MSSGGSDGDRRIGGYNRGRGSHGDRVPKNTERGGGANLRTFGR